MTDDSEKSGERKVSDEENRVNIEEMLDAGSTYNQITAETGASSATIAKVRKAMDERKNLDNPVLAAKLDVKEFMKNLRMLDSIGEKNMRLAEQLVTINPTVLESSKDIYALLTGQLGVKPSTAKILVDGLLARYFKDADDGKTPDFAHDDFRGRQDNPYSAQPGRNMDPRYYPQGQMMMPGMPFPGAPGGDTQYIIEKQVATNPDGTPMLDGKGNPIFNEVRRPFGSPSMQTPAQGAPPQQTDPTKQLMDLLAVLREMGVIQPNQPKGEASVLEKSLEGILRQNTTLLQAMMQAKEQGRQDRADALTPEEALDQMRTEQKKLVESIEQAKQKGEIGLLRDQLQQLLSNQQDQRALSVTPEERNKVLDMDLQERTAVVLKDGFMTLAERMDKTIERVATIAEAKASERAAQQIVTPPGREYENLVAHLKAQGHPDESARQIAQQALYTVPQPTAQPPKQDDELAAKLRAKATDPGKQG